MNINQKFKYGFTWVFFIISLLHSQVWLPPYYIKAKNEETKLEFYGKLVDQDEQPVPEATVHYTVSYVGLVKPEFTKRETKTDTNGLFEIHGGKVAKLYIDKFEHTGYEYKQGETGFEFQNIYRDCHKADKEKPVVFHIRKKHMEAVYLSKKGFRLSINPEKNKQWAGYDISGNGMATPQDKYMLDGRCFFDFELAGKFNAEKQAWSVTFKANGDEAGLQFSDKLLYEAPPDGYSKEITLTFPVMKTGTADKVFPKYIYARVRKLGFYMRLTTTTVFIDNGRFVTHASGFLNPFGGRCLEPLDIIDWEEKKKLDRATNDALLYQKLVPMPDFEQWIREGKAKY